MKTRRVKREIEIDMGTGFLQIPSGQTIEGEDEGEFFCIKIKGIVYRVPLSYFE